MLWVIFALLLAATLATILFPLWRTPGAVPARAAYDLAVFRNQLAEVDADVERGLVLPDQAEGARLEIQRRMLAAGPGNAPSDNPRARKAAAVVISIILPLGAGLLYAAYGNPRLPGEPYAYRLRHEPAVILAHTADRLSAQLSTDPSAAGYLRLAELYSQGHDFDHAEEAFRRAIALGADTASSWAGLGEAIVLTSGGAVAPDALDAFARALELDRREPRARFYAGMAEAQIGNVRNAVAIWRDLEDDSRSDEPWLPLLREEIAAAARLGKFNPAAVPPTPASAAALRDAVTAMNKAMER